MAFEKITDTDLVDKGISGLPDVPGLTTAAMQAKFDELSKDVIIPKLNAIVEGLNGTEVGNSSKVTDPTEQKEKTIQNTIDAIYAIVAANAEAKHTHSNKTDLDKITSTFLDAVSSLIQMLSGISSVATSVTDDDTIIPTAGAIVDYVVKLGAGDMTKAVYDKDNDGVVDDASKLGGEAPSSYLKVAELSDAAVEFSEASTRENIQTGEDVKTVFGKVAKWFADMTAAAFAQTITSYEDLMANTVSGYLADALAVKSGFETINSNLTVDTTNLSDDYTLNSLLQLLAEKYFSAGFYLYKDGDLCVDNSGGWVPNGNQSDYSLNDNGCLYLKGGNWGTLKTVNQSVDVSSFTKLHILIKSCDDSTARLYTSSSEYVNVGSVITTPTEKIIDVTSLSSLWFAFSSNGGTIYISKVWLD